jgi:neutral ceramidase
VDRSGIAAAFSLLLFLPSMCSAAPQAGPAGAQHALKAGAARVDITPDLSRFKNIGLGGYGDRYGKFAEGVHDKLYARALVLELPSSKVAIVSLDALIVPPGLKDAVMSHIGALGFEPEQVVICATHSHNAPENLHPGGDIFPRAFGRFHKDFFDWNAERIALAIREANAAVRPARLSITTAAATRRWTAR